MLRPLGPEDYAGLRARETSAELGVRWRGRGNVVSPEQWAQSIWQSVFAQFVIVGVHDRKTLGLVMAYRPSFQDGHAWFGVEKFDAGQRSPLVVLGASLFIEYVFKCWNLTKLYIEVAEYNASQFQSGMGDLFELEGRMRDHFWYDGERWDQLILALYRERWEKRKERILSLEMASPQRYVRIGVPAT